MHEKINQLVPKELMTFLVPTDGLSSSEANHLAEKIKEVVKMYDGDLKRFGVITETIPNFKNGIDVVISNIDHTVPVIEVINKIGDLNSLAAWLRVGVKSKETGLTVLQNIDPDFIEDGPEFEKLKRPEQDEVWKEQFGPDHALAELNIRERAEFLSLNSKAAAIGMGIHNNGPVSKAKQDVVEFKPTRMEEVRGINGPEAWPVTCTKEMEREDVAKIYFQLQNKHREIENKLNFYRAKLKNIEVQKNVDIDKRFAMDLAEANSKHQAEMAIFNKEIQDRNTAKEVWTNEVYAIRGNIINVFASYKIVIPEILEETYNFILKF